MPDDWRPDWAGQIACIIASGPSLTQKDVDACEGHRAIAINESWRMAPWADVLYGCDARWWLARGPRDFEGLRVSRDDKARKKLPGIHFVPLVRRDVFFYDGRKIGWGGNGGFQAVNLAIQFGARRIALLGFDMQVRQGKPLHWHADHKGVMSNPTVGNAQRWRKALDAQAEPAKKHGVEIVNCTMKSALENYPKMPIREALARWA